MIFFTDTSLLKLLCIVFHWFTLLSCYKINADSRDKRAQALCNDELKKETVVVTQKLDCYFARATSFFAKLLPHHYTDPLNQEARLPWFYIKKAKKDRVFFSRSTKQLFRRNNLVRTA